MPEWLAHLLKSPIPVLLDLLINARSLLVLLLGGLIWAASRLGLWERYSKQNLRDWIHRLNDESKRSEVRRKLIACGREAVFPLVESLEKTDSEKRRELIVDVLCKIGTPALRSLLLARREQSIAPLIDKALEERLHKVVEQHERVPASVFERLRRRIARPEQQIVDKLESLRNKQFYGKLGSCLPMKPSAESQKNSGH